MHYAGLDIHQKFIYDTIIDEKTKIVNQGKFTTTEKELFDFLGFLPNKLSFFVESTTEIIGNVFQIIW